MKTLLTAVSLSLAATGAMANGPTETQELAWGYINPTGLPYEGSSFAWQLTNGVSFVDPAHYEQGSDLQNIAQGNMDWIAEFSPEAYAELQQGNDYAAMGYVFNLLSPADQYTIQSTSVAEGGLIPFADLVN